MFFHSRVRKLYDQAVKLFENPNLDEAGTEKAMELLEESAAGGYVDAQLMLGALLAEVGKHKPAIDWYLKAAEQDHAEAQLELGKCYENGLGVEADLQKAAHWFQKAAELGDAEAQLRLSVAYSKGQGVPKDGKQAVYWSKIAAGNGVINAELNLGIMYFKGDGIPRDNKEAAKWFGRAAEHGDPEAQFALGSAGLSKGVPLVITFSRTRCEFSSIQSRVHV